MRTDDRENILTQLPEQPPSYVYKFHANPNRTSDEKAFYIQEYLKAESATLLPQDIVFLGTHERTIELLNALNEGKISKGEVIAEWRQRTPVITHFKDIFTSITAHPFVLSETDKWQEQYEKRVQEITQYISSCYAVQLDVPSGNTYIVAPSVKQEGKYQLTCLYDGMALSDTQFDHHRK